MDFNDRVKVLSKFLNENVSEDEQITEEEIADGSIDDTRFEIFDNEFEVYSDEEAETATRESVFDLILDGEFVNVPDWKNFIDEKSVKEFLEDDFYDMYSDYSYDELIEEAENSGISTENYTEDDVSSIISELISQRVGNNPLETLFEFFDEESIVNFIKNETISYDYDDLIDYIVSVDGRGHFLAYYDGVEHQVEYNGQLYYVYQTN